MCGKAVGLRVNGTGGGIWVADVNVCVESLADYE